MALAVVTISVLPSASADDLRDKQKKVGRDIRKAHKEVGESSRELSQARSRLKKAEVKLRGAQKTLSTTRGQLQVARVKDAKMQKALAAANSKLATTRAQLKAAEEEVVSQRNEMASTVAQNYQQGDPQLMGLVAMLKSGSPKEITSQVNTVHNLMNRQASLLDSLRAAEKRMEALEKQVFKDREAAAAQKAASRKVVVRRAALEKQASVRRGQVASLWQARSVARASAAKVLARDKKILRQLKKEENRIRDLIIARAAKSGKGYRGDAGGFLMRPVPGVVTSPYGYRRHPIYGYYGLHDGTDFRTPCGQTMVAAGTGTVISRYWSDVYGNRLVIDMGRVNGKSLAVVYNHASGYSVGEGDRVRRGQVVGNAGSTGWSTGCHLHFSVMLNGNSTNPMRYF